MIDDHIAKKFIFHTQDDEGPNFEINPKNIYQFFAEGAKYKTIPDYQRPYSWETIHLKKLLDDIYDVYLGKQDSWYMGSIYVTRKSSSSEQSFILDGQQRITTLNLIFNELYLSIYYDDRVEFSSKRIKDARSSLEECLFTRKGGNRIPSFTTDKNTNEFYQKHIKSSTEIEDSEEYNKYFKSFKSKQSTALETSKSAQTLWSNVLEIKKYLNEKLFVNGENIEENIIKFIEVILYNFWLIEIPLIKETASVEIFESLNNRGKPLTLVDKLQFKTLTKFKDKNELIRNNWSEIYKYNDKLERIYKTKIFSSDENFFQIYFISKFGKELNESESLEAFSKVCLKDYESLELFFNEIKRIYSFYISLNNPIESKFISSFKAAEKKKVKAITQYLKLQATTFKNTNYLLINLLIEYDYSNPSHNYIFIQSIWSIIKLSFIKEIIENESSNNIRSSYNRINKKTNKVNEKNEENVNYEDKSLFTRLIHSLINDAVIWKIDSEEEDNHIVKLKLLTKDKEKYDLNYIVDSNSMLLKTSKNDVAKNVLYFYNLITSYDSLNIYSDDERKNENLEHIFPRAWKKFWKDKTFTKEDISKHLLSLGKEGIANMISKDNFDIELNDYTTIPPKNDDHLIEWIGNKLILNGSQNSKISNKDYDTKYAAYINPKAFLVLPEISQDSEINSDDFSFVNILNRSLIITNKIAEKIITMNWDEIE